MEKNETRNAQPLQQNLDTETFDIKKVAAALRNDAVIPPRAHAHFLAFPGSVSVAVGGRGWR